MAYGKPLAEQDRCAGLGQASRLQRRIRHTGEIMRRSLREMQGRYRMDRGINGNVQDMRGNLVIVIGSTPRMSPDIVE